MASISHHCPCRPGDDCPGAVPGHGTWAFRASAGKRADGKRRQVYRSGFESADAAEKAVSADLGLVFAVAESRLRSSAYRRAAAEMLAEDGSAFELSGSSDGFVYVIRCDGYLKIGYTVDPQRRFDDIRRPSTKGRLIEPSDLDRATAVLWLTFPGSPADERSLQRLARNYWSCGEWFHADGPLVHVLENCAKRCGSVMAP